MKPHDISLRPLLSHYAIGTPVDWIKEFGRDGGLEVEIGSGVGEFIVRNALRYPERNFVGIEHDWKRVQKILRKIAQTGCRNIRLFSLDARIVFELFLTPLTVARVYCLFPDPWPKRRHQKHRLISTAFLKQVNNRLRDGGEFKIVTDFYPYVQWILKQSEATGFQIESKSIPPQFDTKFERKWTQKGQQCFYELCLIKGHHVPESTKEVRPLKKYIFDRFNPERVDMKNETGNISVVFKELLYDVHQKKAMVRLIVTEDRLTQNIWIAIVCKKDGWHVDPAPGCSFFMNDSVHRALDLVFEAAKESGKDATPASNRI